MYKLSNVVSHAGLYCCDRAATHCQMACRQILRTMSTEHEIMEGLIKECGSQPLPQEPMWQCFLSSVQTPSITEEDNLPAKMDCAKLHCCSKANTSLCRYATFSSWHQWKTVFGCHLQRAEVNYRLIINVFQGHVSGDQLQLGQPDMARLWPALWVQPSGNRAHQLPGWRQRALPAGLQGPHLLHQLQ